MLFSVEPENGKSQKFKNFKALLEIDLQCRVPDTIRKASKFSFLSIQKLS